MSLRGTHGRSFRSACDTVGVARINRLLLFTYSGATFPMSKTIIAYDFTTSSTQRRQ